MIGPPAASVCPQCAFIGENRVAHREPRQYVLKNGTLLEKMEANLAKHQFGALARLSRVVLVACLPGGQKEYLGRHV